jgi:hypothetical protein
MSSGTQSRKATERQYGWLNEMGNSRFATPLITIHRHNYAYQFRHRTIYSANKEAYVHTRGAWGRAVSQTQR